MFSKILFSIMFICSSVQLYAQNQLEAELYNRIVEIVEQTTESDESNTDFNTFLETLQYYALHPLNINTAREEDFSELGFLTDIEIQRIIKYRETLTGYVEVGELLLAGLSKQTVQDMAIFCTVKSNEIQETFRNPLALINKLDHQFFMRYQRVLEEQKGYEGLDPKYAGDPNKYYLRYTANYYKTLQIGAVLEKDDGEAFYQKNNPFSMTKPMAGFDYRNGYLALKTRTLFKYTVIGSYTLQLGQGLLAWSGLALGKSAYSLQAKKMGRMIQPYSSANESLFLKGIATQIVIKNITILPYFSSKYIDANVVQLNVDSIGSGDLDKLGVSALPVSGYHRTAGEIEDKDAIRETIVGLSVGTSVKGLDIRCNTQTLRYSLPLQQGNNLYEVDEFAGNRLDRASLDYKYLGDKWMVFGESAIQSFGRMAHLIGVTTTLTSQLDLITIYRNYTAGYYAPYANGFGERKSTNNEKGLFFGFEFRPKKGWNINGYIDNYKKPWLTSSTSAPSSGTDFLFQVNQEKSREFQHYLRVKHEVNQVNTLTEVPIRFLESRSTFRMRYHLNFSPLRSLSLKSRIEISSSKQEGVKEMGTLVYQDLKFTTFHYKLDWSARIAFFNTPSFNTAIYAYESDVLYYFSVPAYFNKGVRYYLMASFDITKKIKLWARFSRWIYTDVSTISSGNSEILGDTKSDIRIQLRRLF